MERHDNPNPLANSLRAERDRRAPYTGEPTSQQRDEQAERERVAEKAKDEAVAKAIEAEIKQCIDELLNKDDRTSPEEWPEMMMLTADELAEYMRRAARAAGIGGGNG